jgi:hypothetical protein
MRRGERAVFPLFERACKAGVLDSGDGLIVAPTATGKSYIGRAILRRAVQRGEAGVHAYLVPYRALAAEMYDSFLRDARAPCRRRGASRPAVSGWSSCLAGQGQRPRLGLQCNCGINGHLSRLLTASRPRLGRWRILQTPSGSGVLQGASLRIHVRRVRRIPACIPRSGAT